MPYQLLVNDNFHYQDESYRSQQGEYETYEQALTSAKAIVDDFLVQNLKEGMSAEQLFETYRAYGEDPWIFCTIPGTPFADFSAWRYAEQRCSEMCRSGTT